MHRRKKKQAKRAGLSPGTLIHIGEKKMEQPRIRIIDFDAEHLQEVELDSIEKCFHLKETDTVSWINIDGLHDISLIENLGKHFRLHPLLLEDIVHTSQRPKMEDFDEFIYVVLKMLRYLPESNDLELEQFSLILGKQHVITFQERVGDVFEPVRERIRKGSQRILSGGTDYLAYALLDAIIDNYFLIIEEIGDELEALEEEVIHTADDKTLQKIFTHRKNISHLRRAVIPVRDLLNSLLRDELPLIQDKTDLYLRDAYDHLIRVVESTEHFREIVAGLLEAYRSTVSNKMNEIMKVLTIIATIFIPLTFIAGIYGMNFKYMPELDWQWGYPLVAFIMAALGAIMLAYFRKKRWL